MPILHSLTRKAAYYFRRPIVLVIHRSTGAAGSTAEPLSVELEHVIPIELQDTQLELPAVSVEDVTTIELARVLPMHVPAGYEEQEDLEKTLVRMRAINLAEVSPATDETFLLDQTQPRTPAAPPPINLFERRTALFDDHVKSYNEPIARIAPETVHIMNTVVTFRDRNNHLTLDALCARTIEKHQKSVSLLPTHLIINSMRLISERHSDAWETYRYKTAGGSEVAIKLRGMKNCAYNVARAIIEDDNVKVA